MRYFNESLFFLWVEKHEIVPGKIYPWSEVIEGWFERPFLLLGIVISVIGGVLLFYFEKIIKR